MVERVKKAEVQKHSYTPLQLAEIAGLADDVFVGITLVEAPQEIGASLMPAIPKIRPDKLRRLGYTEEEGWYVKQVGDVTLKARPGEAFEASWPGGVLKVTRDRAAATLYELPSPEILNKLRDEADALAG